MCLKKGKLTFSLTLISQNVKWKKEFTFSKNNLSGMSQFIQDTAQNQESKKRKYAILNLKYWTGCSLLQNRGFVILLSEVPLRLYVYICSITAVTYFWPNFHTSLNLDSFSNDAFFFSTSHTYNFINHEKINTTILLMFSHLSVQSFHELPW
jgi:hypothetical protein